MSTLLFALLVLQPTAYTFSSLTFFTEANRPGVKYLPGKSHIYILYLLSLPQAHEFG